MAINFKIKTTQEIQCSPNFVLRQTMGFGTKEM